MSLSTIRANELRKKRNVLPKPRCILADPVKHKFDLLTNQDLEELRESLTKAIAKSELTAKAYANNSHISIGLGSVLRAINGGRAGCVFLSADIKPRHVINLITGLARTKCPLAPIYVEREFEAFVDNLFNVRALALSLPQPEHLIETVKSWLTPRLRNLETPKINAAVQLMEDKPSSSSSIQVEPKKSKRKLKTTQKVPLDKLSAESAAAKSSAVPLADNAAAADFISFEGTSINTKWDANKDKERLVNILSEMAMAPVKTELMPKPSCSIGASPFVDDAAATKLKNLKDLPPAAYTHLKLLKIRPNPNRVKKQKNKKKMSK